jgi:site-specific recombinase XerC
MRAADSDKRHGPFLPKRDYEDEAQCDSNLSPSPLLKHYLFAHLVKFDVVEMNPVRDVERPAVNRREGMTLAFSQKQARSILNVPASNTLPGVRDRAILAVGLQVGFRRAEIGSLKVGDFHMNRGFDSLKVVRKGGKKGSSPFTRRPHSASGTISLLPNTAMISKDSFSGQSATIAKALRHVGPCTLT